MTRLALQLLLIGCLLLITPAAGTTTYSAREQGVKAAELDLTDAQGPSLARPPHLRGALAREGHADRSRGAAMYDPSRAAATSTADVDAIIALLDAADTLIAATRARYGHDPALLFLRSLRTAGAATDAALVRVFTKCVTPGSVITIGVLGGSISLSAERASAWPNALRERLAALCPSATVALANGARNASGSLTLGLCARAAAATTHADMWVLEFTLNDSWRYTLGRTAPFNSLPYELAMRTVLTAFNHPSQPPALFHLYFWGGLFHWWTPQPALESLAAHYGTVSLSIRDMVWALYLTETPPYANKEDIIRDKHHPTEMVEAHAADLLALYVATRAREWALAALQAAATSDLSSASDDAVEAAAAAVAAAAGRDIAVAAAPPAPPLPAPVNALLRNVDLDGGRVTCALVPDDDGGSGGADSGDGDGTGSDGSGDGGGDSEGDATTSAAAKYTPVLLPGSQGFTITSDPACVSIDARVSWRLSTSDGGGSSSSDSSKGDGSSGSEGDGSTSFGSSDGDGARALVRVTVAEGRLWLSTCVLEAVDAPHYTGDSDGMPVHVTAIADSDGRRVAMSGRPVLPGVPEMYALAPLLPPGDYVLEMTPNGDCEGDSNCSGFVAIAAL